MSKIKLPPSAMPPKFLRGTTLNTTMGELFVSDQAHPGRLFGFVLPDFQRGDVWTRDQQIRFMESVWLELPIGAYMINIAMGHKSDYYLLDGQQRLRAIRAYIDNEFKVFGYYFRQLPLVDLRRFRSTAFPRIEVHEKDESVLKEIYNRFNFGGTPHKPEEIAK